MEATDRTQTAASPRDDAGGPVISAYATSEKRTVFTESGNDDGWIATDHTVEPMR
ncbi:MAG: hypothetical protein ABEJ40_09450 [Haloarculaceae archaeon]